MSQVLAFSCSRAINLEPAEEHTLKEAVYMQTLRIAINISMAWCFVLVSVYPEECNWLGMPRALTWASTTCGAILQTFPQYYGPTGSV